jgi:hypothetical protein
MCSVELLNRLIVERRTMNKSDPAPRNALTSLTSLTSKKLTTNYYLLTTKNNFPNFFNFLNFNNFQNLLTTIYQLLTTNHPTS